MRAILCRGSDGEHSCTVTYASSDGTWSTWLEGRSDSTEAVVGGTITIESGSGTVILEGAGEYYSYPISPERNPS